ncbi:dihydroorotase [Alicyclobacillus tolerans]|uniref:Dihydroorotase n=2 Tax=Alicyclobacillus tolerans TaxID=90970 RepID=A0A1M6Q6G2_9BACL|nr:MULTISPECIES: dihydroorotase [Alicyclobacillus]MDP9728416.1 dihydroorotase [Alicyclobacillus tengchongensis]QRF23792.1 dihydroorotase [Alicyclobacillus sp. TC]SHK15864.1 dihydroorotase [Alicyclobacillus montanus]
MQGGCLLDLLDNSQEQADILIESEHGRILSIGKDLPEAEQTIDVAGLTLLPAFVDPHVHFREPGFEHKETIASGAKAAVAGGFGSVLCMPNTNPPIDTPERVEYVLQKSAEAGACRVWPMGCITREQKGEQLTDFAALQSAGVAGLSDDGKGVQHGGLMRQALFAAAASGLTVAIHAEDETIAGKGVLHPAAAKKFSVPEQPGSSESAMIARDLLLAEETGARLHLCHVSLESAVSLLAWAKSRGLRVTAEVTPHHLLLSEESIDEENTFYKVNPPLRSEDDRKACLRAFLDGTIDMIATDHAPHTEEEKAVGWLSAPFGMVGIEIVFPLLYTHLVSRGLMSLSELVKRMSLVPAQAFNLPASGLRPGALADLTAVDLQTERRIEPNRFYSKGRNTPFTGWMVRGWPVMTMVDGKMVFDARQKEVQC